MVSLCETKHWLAMWNSNCCENLWQRTRTRLFLFLSCDQDKTKTRLAFLECAKTKTRPRLEFSFVLVLKKVLLQKSFFKMKFMKNAILHTKPSIPGSMPMKENTQRSLINISVIQTFGFSEVEGCSCEKNPRWACCRFGTSATCYQCKYRWQPE